MFDLRSILFHLAQSMPGFLLAIVTHEAAHAWMANKFGDPTAKNEGRITLNPVAHADPVGTIFIPILVAFTTLPIIGWARPVPIEVRNFKNFRTGLFWVSFAGPLANILLGAFSAIILAFLVTQVSVDWEYHSIFVRMLQYSISINFVLACFNLLPLPPLDGSKMVSSFLKGPALYKYESLARFTPIFFIGLLALSYVGIDILSYIFLPANYLANFFMFAMLALFGGIG